MSCHFWDQIITDCGFHFRCLGSVLLCQTTCFWGKPAAMTWSSPLKRSTRVMLEVDLLGSAESPMCEFRRRSSPTWAFRWHQCHPTDQPLLCRRDFRQEPPSYVALGFLSGILSFSRFYISLTPPPLANALFWEL